MSELINGKLHKSNQQRLEELYSWSMLYSGRGLAKSTVPNETMHNKVSLEIQELRKKLFGKWRNVLKSQILNFHLLNGYGFYKELKIK